MKFIGITFILVISVIIFAPLSDAGGSDIWKLCSSLNYKDVNESYTCCKTPSNTDEWVSAVSSCKLPTAVFDSPPSGWQGPGGGSFLVSFTFTADNELDTCEWKIWSYNGVSWVQTSPAIGWHSIACSGTSPVSTSDSLGMGASQKCRDTGTGRCKLELRVSDGLNTVTNSMTFDIDIIPPPLGTYTITGNPHKGAQSSGPVYTKGPLTHTWSGFTDIDSGSKWFEVWRAGYAISCPTGTEPTCTWIMQHQDASAASGSWPETITSGDYWYGFHSVDNVGNIRFESTPIRVIYDGTSPTAPTYNTAESLTFNSAPSLDIDFSDNKELEKIECKFNAGGTYGFIDSSFAGKDYIASWSVNNCGSWSSLSDGVYYIYFRITDEANNLPYETPNNAGAFEIIKDTTAPSFTIQYYSGSGLTSSLGNNPKLKAGTYYLKITSNEALGSTPTISINAEGTANDVTNAATTSVGGNDYKYTRIISTDVVAVGVTLEDISISGSDTAGNPATNVNPTNEATKAAYTDTTPPNTAITSGPSEGAIVNSNSASFTYSSTEAGTFECKLDSPTFSSCPNAGKIYTSLPDSSHTFEVRAIDQAGNPDPTPASRTWISDITPPLRTSGAPTGMVTTPNPTMSLNTNEASNCRYSTTAGTDYDSMSPLTQTPSSTSHSWSLGPLTPADYVYYIRCKDVASNKNSNDCPGPATDCGTISFSVCARSNPGVTILPPLAHQGEPGDTKTNTIKVTNEDLNCGTEIFDLTTTGCPAGWTCTFASPSLSIPSGGSFATTTLSITSSLTASAGINTINVKAQNTADPSKFDIKSVSYEVICIYRLSIKPMADFDLATKHGSFTGVQKVWSMSFKDSGSSTSCPQVGGKLQYQVPSTTLSGTCHTQTGIYTGTTNPPAGVELALPFKFSVVRNGDSNNAFKVFAKRQSNDFCTISFNIEPTQPGTLQLDPSFTVGPLGAPTQPPHIGFFDFSGDASVLSVKWEAFYPDEPFRTMEVKCGLNCDPSGIVAHACTANNEKCLPYPVSHGTEEIKKGSCAVSSPAYSFSTDKVICRFYDPTNPSLETFINHDFIAIDFDIRATDKITTTVGHQFDLKIDVANKGKLTDSYKIEVLGPATVDIAPTTITTTIVGTNKIVSTFSSVTPLVGQSETLTVKVTSLTSGKVVTKNIEISPGLFALPEFGLIGFLQIVAIAAVVYFLLANKMFKKKRKRR